MYYQWGTVIESILVLDISGYNIRIILEEKIYDQDKPTSSCSCS